MGLLKTYAAALAFYFVLSLVPFLVVSTTIINLVAPFDLSSEFAEILKSILPPNSGLDSNGIVLAAKKNADSGFKTMGFILAVWTSTSFMTLLFSALHLIFDSKRRLLPPRGIIPQLKSFILLFIWMNTLLLTAFCFIFSVLLQKDMMETFFHPWVATTSGWLMRDLSVFVILLIAFVLTYLTISGEEVSIRLHIQGATFPRWAGSSSPIRLPISSRWSGNKMCFMARSAELLPRSCALTPARGPFSSAPAGLPASPSIGNRLYAGLPTGLPFLRRNQKHCSMFFAARLSAIDNAGSGAHPRQSPASRPIA